MVPYQESTPSLFSRSLFEKQHLADKHARDGTREPQRRLRLDASFHRKGDPLREGHPGRFPVSVFA